MKKSTALARRPQSGLEQVRPLTPRDMTDASLSTLDRAQALRHPQAQAAAKLLSAINGRPLGPKVLILPLPPDDHFSSIIIPESAREDQTTGIIVAVGKGHLENGVRVPLDVAPGNYVHFSKYAAQKIKVGEYELFQIHEGDISFAAGGVAQENPDA